MVFVMVVVRMLRSAVLCILKLGESRTWRVQSKGSLGGQVLPKQRKKRAANRSKKGGKGPRT
jgi:hypothetical protein